MENTLNISQSRERLIKQLSSSIFSSETSSQAILFKPRKRLTRDNSAESFSHGIKRYGTPTSLMLKPLDHSSIDFFGDSPREFYQKNQPNFYETLKMSKLQQKLKKKPALHPQTLAKTPENQFILYQEPKKDVLSEPISNVFQEYQQNIQSFSNKSSEKSLEKTNYILPKPEEAKIELIMIKGLKSSDNELTIKDLCQGIHVIEINPEIDNMTGSCLGNAKLKIRAYPKSSNFERFKRSLVQKGLEVSYISSSNGRKNNYHTSGRDFLDSQLQQEEKRLVCNNLNSNERKRALLGTSDDLFGNTPGTGKWDNLAMSQFALKENHQSHENLRKWESLRKSSSKSPITAKKISNSGYLKPTLSSVKKDVKYKT